MGGFHPPLRFGFGGPASGIDEHRFVLPFRRSWPMIGVTGVFLTAMCVPLVLVGRRLDLADGELFSLTFELFSLFWLLGWSVGVAVLGLVLLVLLAGREVLVAAPGTLVLRLDLLGIGVSGHYEGAGIRELRHVPAPKHGGDAWRGTHLAFEYRGKTVAFGSAVSDARASEILTRLRESLSMSPRPGAMLNDRVETSDRSPGPDAPSSIVAPFPTGPPATEDAPGLTSPSTLALILANLVPLAGVLLLGWDLGAIMILYWAESAVVGVVNLLKMAMIGKWTVLLLGPFFLGHYGGFMAGHLLFIYALFVQGIDGGEDLPVSEVMRDFLGLWPALLATVVSHGLSFRLNFIGRREYVGRRLRDQMHDPYARIIAMHVTIIFGGFVALLLGTPLPALALLVVLKTGADARAHLREHDKSRPRQNSSARETAGHVRTRHSGGTSGSDRSNRRRN